MNKLKGKLKWLSLLLAVPLLVVAGIQIGIRIDTRPTGDTPVMLGSNSSVVKDIIVSHNLYFFPVDPSASAPTAAINPTAGNLNGTYRYAITFVTADGETNVQSYSPAVSPVNEQVDLSSIAVSSDSRVVARRIYRNTGVYTASTNIYLVATINDNTSTKYTDNIPDGDLGSRVPVRNTTGGEVIVNNIPHILTSGITALGREAGLHNLGTYNTYIGWNSGRGVDGQSTGWNNAAVGTATFKGITTGNFNVGFGDGAGQFLTTGSKNVFLGDHTGYGNPMTGDGNTIVGSQSGNSLTAGSGNVWIGNDAGRTLNTANNTLIIANTNTVRPLIYGEFPNTLLRLNAASVSLPNGSPLQWLSTSNSPLSVLYLDPSNQTRLDSPVGLMYFNSGIAQDIVYWGSAAGTGRKLVLGATNANDVGQLRDSPSLNLRARHWAGANTLFDAVIFHDMITAGDAPKSQLKMSINSVNILTLENNNGVAQVIVSVPNVDPGISGALWNDGGTVKISP